MIRLLEIAVFSFLLLCPAGCNESEQKNTLWQDIKLGDLSPSDDTGRPAAQPLKTVNFNVYIFEMPAAKVGELSEAWRMLGDDRVRLRHREAFRANAFLVGFGQSRVLRDVIGVLDGADGSKVQTVSLLLPDGQSNYVQAARLRRKQTVFYTSGDGSLEGRDVGPGELALRIRAESVFGLRGICNVHADTVFARPPRGLIGALAGRAKSPESVFEPVGFGLTMAPGDFFLLGPEKYVEDPMTLASNFFSRPAPSPGVSMLWTPRSSGTNGRRPYFGPVVRTYMVLCTGINY